MTIAAYAEHGQFAPRKMAAVLRTTSDELAGTLGLGKDAIQRKDRIASDRTQRRLRQMAEVLSKVEPRFGSAMLAYAWYRSEPLRRHLKVCAPDNDLADIMRTLAMPRV
uniref:hypothetical protein n=1 Tax=Novosphingobium aquimarinum TaxID=2682494 RepID=UPI0018DDDF22